MTGTIFLGGTEARFAGACQDQHAGRPAPSRCGGPSCGSQGGACLTIHSAVQKTRWNYSSSHTVAREARVVALLAVGASAQPFNNPAYGRARRGLGPRAWGRGLQGLGRPPLEH